jgi:uncharacterized membrane protein YjjP (DUF1212 family)
MEDSTTQRLSDPLLAGDNLKLTFLTDHIIDIVKISNVIFSVVACAVFLNYHYYGAVLEYTQIWFLSVLVAILDSNAGRVRTFYYFLEFLAAIAWSVAAVYTESWYLPPADRVLLSFDAVVYMLGSIACAMVIVNRPKVVEGPKIPFIELDLLIYLVSLNVLCILPVNDFNVSLHMILDIRLVVLLYTGLMRPLDKMDLLHDPSFVIVLLSIIIFFVMYSVASGNWIVIALAFVVNCTILFLLYFANMHKHCISRFFKYIIIYLYIMRYLIKKWC